MKHTSRELMLDPNEIIYRCTNCNTVFRNVPPEECRFCNQKFDVTPKLLRPDPNEADYFSW